VGTVAGGFRSNWIDTWAKEFELKYAEYSFEEGKKGVEIHPVEKTNIYQLDIAAQNVRDADYDAGDVLQFPVCIVIVLDFVADILDSSDVAYSTP
jgi:hypothetical protein